MIRSSAKVQGRNNSCIYLKELAAKTWEMVSILQDALGFKRSWVWRKNKNTQMCVQGVYLRDVWCTCGTFAAPALNKAAQPIHCACNKFIHPYRHTGKQDTQGDGRGKRVISAETEGYISPPHFVSLGVWVIRLSPQSLQLKIGLPPLPPAVCPVKSTHDVSLSQLWVEIHRINRFVRQTHAWEFLQIVRLVHAMEKQGNTPMHAFTNMHLCR